MHIVPTIYNQLLVLADLTNRYRLPLGQHHIKTSKRNYEPLFKAVNWTLTRSCELMNTFHFLATFTIVHAYQQSLDEDSKVLMINTHRLFQYNSQGKFEDAVWLQSFVL